MEKIELRKIRDFGALFNDSIRFLRVNFKSFFGIMLTLAGPFVMITGLLMGYLFNLLMKVAQGNAIYNAFGGAGAMAGNFLGTTLIFVLIFILTTLVANATVYLFFQEYIKSDENSLPVQRSSIAPHLAGASVRLFLNYLLFAVFIGLAVLVLGLIIGFLITIPVLNILLAIALVFAYLIFLPVIYYVIGAANYLVIRDKILITEAMGRVVRYLRGNFWWTWLYTVAVSMMAGTINMIFWIPFYIIIIVMGVTTRSGMGQPSDYSLLMIISSLFMFSGFMIIVNPVVNTFIIFNYHNHEERHEGHGLMGRIETMDNKETL